MKILSALTGHRNLNIFLFLAILKNIQYFSKNALLGRFYIMQLQPSKTVLIRAFVIFKIFTATIISCKSGRNYYWGSDLHLSVVYRFFIKKNVFRKMIKDIRNMVLEDWNYEKYFDLYAGKIMREILRFELSSITCQGNALFTLKISWDVICISEIQFICNFLYWHICLG